MNYASVHMDRARVLFFIVPRRVCMTIGARWSILTRDNHRQRQATAVEARAKAEATTHLNIKRFLLFFLLGFRASKFEIEFRAMPHRIELANCDFLNGDAIARDVCACGVSACVSAVPLRRRPTVDSVAIRSAKTVEIYAKNL